MLPPTDESPDDSQKPTTKVNEDVISLAAKRLKQGITPAESRRRLIEQGYTEEQVQTILDSALKKRSLTSSGNPWAYAGIGLLLWVLGAAIRISGRPPGMGAFTIFFDIAGLVFIVLSIRSALSSE